MPSTVSLRWPHVPCTKRVARVEENTAADQIELSGAQIERLNNLTPALESVAVPEAVAATGGTAIDAERECRGGQRRGACGLPKPVAVQ